MEELDRILAAAPARIAAASSLSELDSVATDLAGRKSVIAEARRSLGARPSEERKALGAAINAAQLRMDELVARRRSELEILAENLEGDRIDLTLPAIRLHEGTEHILQQTLDEVCEIFLALGYTVITGPEAELGLYNFDALNFPPDHPARLDHQTIFLEHWDAETEDGLAGPGNELLLRTHTSPMQARYMEAHPAPAYVVVPGRVYRSDTLDATHSPVFHQIEGLAVDAGITFSDLKGTLAHFAREFFGPQHKIRLNPSFFPFTEPSAEMAVSCFACSGEGSCRVCGGTGWLELAGCGMVDPNVFVAVGYDSAAVTGFAFGMGAERLAMVRYGIAHITHFYENDLRVLRQFR